MTKSYFPRIVALVPFILISVSIVSKATGYCNGGPYFSSGYNTDHTSWIFPHNTFTHRKPYDTHKKLSSQLFFKKSYEWLLTPSRTKKEEKKAIDTVHYQAEESIFFDAKKKTLSLHGGSTLSYDKMKLEAHVVSLDLNSTTIHAEGTKDLQNKSIGSPIFTYQDVTKNKYGKDGSTQTRIFFIEKIWYNIDTKRALVDTLLTKQEESIIKSKQVKKEDEETFYAEDIIYTTCGLAHPHFYIRTKRAKMIQDKQITSGPFRLYFDGVPTPLGCIFGTLFLEGKRTHGIIPPEIGEGENGFYLRNGGYYINFNDYVDISILGSIYSSGIAELNNTLHYKKRYQFSGDVFYVKNIMEKERGWSLKWEHKTLTRGPRTFSAKFDLHNKSYKILNDEDKKIPKKTTQESSASLSYNDKLIGLPYNLTLRAEFKHNLVSNFKHWTLPTGTLNSSSWYPLKMVQSGGTNRWFHNMELKHNICFENHFQNTKKEPSLLSNKSAEPLSLTCPWNRYTEHGIKHTIPLSMRCKLFDHINFTPHFTYNEGWYWLKKKKKGDIKDIGVPGFNRVYTWDFGAKLGTTLYHTHYFADAALVEGFRIKTEPSIDFTYTPDFSNKYFFSVENEKGEKEKKYAFEGLRPGIGVANRTTSVLSCTLHNTVELKVKKTINPEKKDKEKEKKRTSHKIFLLKNLDFKARYDFKAEKCHLTDGIGMHIASEAKIGKIGKIGFDFTTNFDPYKYNPEKTDANKIKEEATRDFAWSHGEYLARVKEANCKIHIDIAHYSSKDKKKKKELLNDYDGLANKMEDHKIDFESPWSLGSEFNFIYKKLYEYEEGKKDYSIEKYITFNGSITLVKKWKINLNSTYNFTKNEFDPSATEVSIQRDLHCWQLSYKWHPLGDSPKYDFSLGVKANVLKVLKLPRKRSYNKLS